MNRKPLFKSHSIVSQKSFEKIMAYLLPIPPEKIAIAVSGGSDSLCLLYLLHQWASNASCPITLYPFIVNHSLRATAQQEAEQTKTWIKTWGLDAEILFWHHPPLSTGIMESARQGRYEVLALACHRLGITHLCTAHHQDDVLETVLMRQYRQSCWRGLSGISALTHRYGVMLVRPFLGIPKEILTFTLHSIGQSWIEDPTNEDLRFTRTQMRAIVNTLSSVQRKNLVNSIQNHGLRRHNEAKALTSLYTTMDELGVLKIEASNELWQCSFHQGCVILQAWIGTFIFSHLPPLTFLWQRLCDSFKKRTPVGPHAVATMGGCLFVRYKQDLYIFREWSRISNFLSQTFSDEGCSPKEFIWDHRFFCYNTGPIHKRPHSSSGSWYQRYRDAGLPSLWPQHNILYKPCGLPYPQFITLSSDDFFI